MTAVALAARLGPLLAGLVCAATAAHADRIDGDWCAPGSARSLHIDGPSIITPGGHRITGLYGRHAFAYTVPAGEPGAGRTAKLRLLNDMEAEVTLGDSFETWRRCQLNS